MSERLVKIASRLYAARDAMRVVHGSNYTQKVADTRPLVELVMRGARCSELVAGLQLAEAAANRGHDGVALMVLATVVEMVEPAAEIRP